MCVESSQGFHPWGKSAMGITLDLRGKGVSKGQYCTPGVGWPYFMYCIVCVDCPALCIKSGSNHHLVGVERMDNKGLPNPERMNGGSEGV